MILTLCSSITACGTCCFFHCLGSGIPKFKPNPISFNSRLNYLRFLRFRLQSKCSDFQKMKSRLQICWVKWLRNKGVSYLNNHLWFDSRSKVLNRASLHPSEYCRRVSNPNEGSGLKRKIPKWRKWTVPKNDFKRLSTFWEHLLFGIFDFQISLWNDRFLAFGPFTFTQSDCLMVQKAWYWVKVHRPSELKFAVQKTVDRAISINGQPSWIGDDSRKQQVVHFWNRLLSYRSP